MPTTQDYPDLPAVPVSAATDAPTLLRELRKRRKSISESDLDALERACAVSHTPPPAVDVAAFKARCIAAVKAVPITDLWNDFGRGQGDMQTRVVAALEGMT